MSDYAAGGDPLAGRHSEPAAAARHTAPSAGGGRGEFWRSPQADPTAGEDGGVTAESSPVEIMRELAENDEELVKVLARRERLLRASAADPSGPVPLDAGELAARARYLALVHGLNPKV